MVGQAILLLSSPLLTRLYTPDQFGLLAVYSGTITILSVFATLGYDSVIPLPRRDDIAASALALSLLCVAVVSTLCAVGLEFGGAYIARVFDTPELIDVAWLIPLGVAGIGSLTAITQWNVRRQRFRIVARVKVIQAASQTGIQILSAGTPIATFGLILGSLIGQTAGLGSSIRRCYEIDASLIHHVTWKRVGFLARYYWKFPTLSIWGSMAYSANNHAPAIIMFWMFGLSTSGFYMLAQRIGMMPVLLLSTAMNQAIYRTLATSKKKPQQVGQAVVEPIRMMMSIVIAPAILAATIVPYAMGVVFGSTWEEAGYYLRWMAPWPAITLIFGVMSPVPSVMGLQKMAVFFQVSSLTAGLGAMVLFGDLWGPVAAIAAFSIVKAFSIAIYRFHMLHLLHVSLAPLVLNFVTQAVYFGVLAWGTVQIFWDANADATFRIIAFVGILIAACGSYIAINLLPLMRVRTRLRHLSAN
jgi:O-antigen/teichoic acid export membrane protein